MYGDLIKPMGKFSNWYDSFTWSTAFVTGFCKNWSYCLWQEVQFFVTNTKTHQYTIKYQKWSSLGWPALPGCFSLAMIIGDPYEWSGSLMELWWEGRGLCVTVKLRGVEWRPLLFLNYHFSWLWALLMSISPLHLLPTIHLPPFPTTLPLLSSPDTTILGPTLVKNYRILQNVWATKLSWLHHCSKYLQKKKFRSSGPPFHREHLQISYKLQKPRKFCPSNILYYTVSKLVGNLFVGYLLGGWF